MTTLRKPNRNSGPARVTQAGTSTSYPHADHRSMATARTRWQPDPDLEDVMTEAKLPKSQWPAYAGLRNYLKVPAPALFVGVYDGREAGMDTDAGRWQTVCEAHGGIISHQSLALANEHAPHPGEWCEWCMDVTSGSPRMEGLT